MVPRVQISKKWPQGPKDPALPAVIFGQKHCHVNPQRVGGNYPNENQKGYYFETKCRIDLKPGCIFKFLCCLDVYVKEFIDTDLEGTLEGFITYTLLGPFQGPSGCP